MRKKKTLTYVSFPLVLIKIQIIEKIVKESDLIFIWQNEARLSLKYDKLNGNFFTSMHSVYNYLSVFFFSFLLFYLSENQ